MRITKLLAVACAGGLLLAACGDDDTDTSADVTTSTTAAEATVELASGGELGDHLVNADGFTLYVFDKDQGTTTACTAACSTNWPALTVAGDPVAGDGVDQAKLAATAGQVTYGGRLLYTFAGDHAAGETNGTKVPSWHAVAPDGTAIPQAEAPAATAPTTPKAATATTKAPATTVAPTTTEAPPRTMPSGDGGY